MFRLLKHNTIAGEYKFSGTIVRMSVFDKVTDDGRLVFHYDNDRYQVLQADEFKIVYDSAQEMERELGKKAK